MIFVHISKLDLHKCKQILDCTRPLGPTRCLRYLSPPLLLSPFLSAKWELATPLENFWAELCYGLIFKVAIWFNKKIPCCMLLSFSETKWTQPLTKMPDTCRIWLFVQGTLDTWHHLNLLLSHSPFLQSAQNLEKYITLSIDLASTTIAVRIQLYQQFKFIWDTPCIHPRLPALELMIVTWTHT